MKLRSVSIGFLLANMLFLSAVAGALWQVGVSSRQVKRELEHRQNTSALTNQRVIVVTYPDTGVK
jgi:hypothetical protein